MASTSKSNKISYLSKYADEPAKKKLKKDKKTKKHSKKQYKSRDALVHDEEEQQQQHRMGLQSNKRESDDDEEDEEDRPMIVPSEDLPWEDRPVTHQPRGTWETNNSNNADGLERNKAEAPSQQTRHDDSKEEDDSVDRPRRHRRQRYDSEADEESPAPRVGKQEEYTEKERTASRRPRYDSDSDNSPPIKREDADVSESKGRHRRRRYDSEEEDNAPAAAARRHDSDSSPPRVVKREDASTARQQRHNASDEEQETRRRRRRYDSDDSDNKNNQEKEDKERMSSGHVAGLQQANKFRQSEKGIQETKRQDAQLMVDKYGMGETVYRDAHGRKTDKPTTTQKSGKTRIELTPQEERRLNQGKAQRQAQENQQKELAILQHSTFARAKDDGYLEEIRKNEIRKDDPMAALARKSQVQKQLASGQAIRKVYKGPPAKPNRFGLLPGYRWDGVDRGNGFEDKLLASKYGVARKKEDAYRWSSADM
jgi:pre-mRNA-splicing factor CWC26